MTLERIAELKDRPIDLTDIPEVTAAQAGEFYPRRLRKSFQIVYSIFDRENALWLEQNGSLNRTAINAALEKLRNETPLRA